MKSWKPLAILGLLASAGVWAQGVSQITIGTSVPGPNFMVDGTTYTQTQVFVWPTGSKHTVQFLFSVDPTTGLTLGYQDTSGDTMRFTFSGWITNTGSLTQTNQAILSITASPDLTSIIANITISCSFFNYTHLKLLLTKNFTPISHCHYFWPIALQTHFSSSCNLCTSTSHKIYYINIINI